jgi:hypothetical protein
VDMIVIGSGIDETIVDNACRSLDTEVKQLSDGGRLEAGKKSSERLAWMKEMLSATREFERVCSRQAYVAHQYIDIVL